MRKTLYKTLIIQSLSLISGLFLTAQVSYGQVGIDPDLNLQRTHNALQETSIADVSTGDILTSMKSWLTNILNHTTFHEKMRESFDTTEQWQNDYFHRESLLSGGGKDEANPGVDHSRKTFGEQSMAAFGHEVKAQSQFLQELTKGMDFNFDLANIFSGSSSSGSVEKSPTVSYGLVIQDFEVENNSPSLDGNQNSIKPQYVIKRKIQGSDEGQQKIRQHQTDTGSKYSTKFKGTVHADQNMTPGKGVPVAMKIRQEQGLYEANIPLGSTKDTEHSFMMPVGKDISLGHKLNAKMKNKQSSVNNVLNTQFAPALNFHYFHIDHQYGSEIDFRNGLSANAKVGQKDMTDKTRQEFHLNYQIPL